MCCAALALALLAANIGAILLKAASDCHTNKPAANNTKKMHDRYLQHVFRWTTKAGSFECSSFVRLKPAAPSKSMAVWGIIFVVLLLRVSGGERAAACYLTALAATRGAALPGLGLWVTADPRLCVARARSGESFAARRVRNERCATYYKPGVQDGGGDSARALSIFFGALGLSAVHQRSGGGSEAVERRTLDRSTEDWVPGGPEHTGFFGTRPQLCRPVTQPLPHVAIA